MASIYDQVAAILLRHAGRPDSIERLMPETALIDGGLDLDSLRLLEAIIEIEAALGVRISDEDLTMAALSSVKCFAEHVSRRAEIKRDAVTRETSRTVAPEPAERTD